MHIQVQHYVCICFQFVYACRFMYIWLYMAIYTHIYNILAPKRCARPFSQHIHTQEAGVRYTKLI